MHRSLVVAIALTLGASVAHADAKADATKAFTDFVTSLATDKPALTGVEAFLPPYLASAALPDAADAANLLEAPKLKVLRAVVSRTGKSAWIVGEVKTASVSVYDDKTKNVTLRASGFLVLDGGAWHVRAADLSRAIKDKVADPGCGNASHQWEAPAKAPKALATPVRGLLESLDDGKRHAAMLSDDKNVLVLGSAPGEQYTGPRAKSVLQKWGIVAAIGGDTKDDELPALAGTGPDGELVWAATGVMAPSKFCTMYRGFFVLAKEGNGWKIVHEHYSTPM